MVNENRIHLRDGVEKKFLSEKSLIISPFTDFIEFIFCEVRKFTNSRAPVTKAKLLKENIFFFF